jgi:hypothetical protein
MYAGDTITTITGQPMKPFTITLAGGEIGRLREALRQVRPTGHDHLCEHGPDGPDTWVDQTEDENFARATMRKVRWEPGQGFMDDSERLDDPAYVGWCCTAATQRHVIDAALGEDVSGTTA